MESSLDSHHSLAIKMAEEAGSMLHQRLYSAHHIEFKGAINLVTEADRLSEEMIIGHIRRSYPSHDIMTEESPLIDNGSAFRWIIDPLDGTTNYAHGYPVFCVSIALEIEGDVVLGVIRNPMLQETFTVRKGKGAFLNGRKIEVSRTEHVSASLLATGFPYDIRESQEDNIAHFSVMAKRAQAIRRAGSAALDMAYVAAGRFDGFWEMKLAPWDTAAGALMIREAGGAVTDMTGQPFSLSSPHVLASNGRIHSAMRDIFLHCA